MAAVNDALAAIQARVMAACQRAARSPGSVQLVAVSKTFPAAALLQAFAAGQEDFGESYLQEALPKIEETEAQAGRPLRWHFIGPLQANKSAAVAKAFTWVHGVDRERIAVRLSEQRPATLPPLNVCVQVNVSGEATKSGCSPADAVSLCATVARLPRLRLRGLMCIPAAEDDPQASRPAFAGLRALFETIRAAGQVDPQSFDTLSMGMSADFEVAVEEGATLIRVGTQIFGTRESTVAAA